MGLVESLNSYSKKQCRSLFWRLRAAMRKKMKNGNKQQFKFRYDPLSYALNFDDGYGNLDKEASALRKTKFQDFPELTRVCRVFIVWVEIH